MRSRNRRSGSPKKRAYFHLKAPDAREVKLCGSFNDWDTRSCPLKRDRKGVWRTSLLLEQGTCEYRFLVDGRWQNDPDAEKTPNHFGTLNCVRVVT